VGSPGRRGRAWVKADRFACGYYSTDVLIPEDVIPQAKFRVFTKEGSRVSTWSNCHQQS
jgi:hypothetical protein